MLSVLLYREQLLTVDAESGFGAVSGAAASAAAFPYRSRSNKIIIKFYFIIV